VRTPRRPNVLRPAMPTSGEDYTAPYSYRSTTVALLHRVLGATRGNPGCILRWVDVTPVCMAGRKSKHAVVSPVGSVAIRTAGDGLTAFAGECERWRSLQEPLSGVKRNGSFGATATYANGYPCRRAHRTGISGTTAQTCFLHGLPTLASHDPCHPRDDGIRGGGVPGERVNQMPQRLRASP
jgi:hypothetical protein